MAAESEGLRIARERIVREREERSGFLDLGRLGLEGWPDELWSLGHLTGLNIGRGWMENSLWREAASDFAPNSLRPEEAKWGTFSTLHRLFASELLWSDLTSLAELTSLQCFDCSYNNITTLEPLERLTSLQFLNCSCNQLATLKPLARLSSLQVVDCSINQLTTLEPVAGLTLLQSLNCSCNPLATLEPLSGLISLLSLNCAQNQLTTLKPLAGLSSLQSLICSCHPLVALVPAMSLISLKSRIPWKDQFTRLEALSYFQSISWSNRLTTLEPLSGLTSLKSLECSHNQLATLEGLTGLTSLRSLKCSHNQLTTLEPLAKLPSLQSLDCSNNQLTTLEPLTRLSSLQSLECSFNQLTTLGPLAGLASLQFLNCSHNRLTALPKFHSLQSLECSHNRLTTLEPLTGLSSLQSLHCSGNLLTTLEPLAGLTSLRSLDCSHNRWLTLEPLAELVSLQSLHCSGNLLTTLDPLAGLASLQSLHCPHNRLTTLEPLTELTSLQSLDCSHNQLTTLEPLAGLASLQHLRCSFNQLTTLEPLTGLPSLQSLNCSSNPLSDLHLAIIWHETLQELILFDTSIPHIPAEVLSENARSSCLETLRGHLHDLEEGVDLFPDVKVMVLGNGRIGKTQICNRLRGLPFEENAESTHGVTVASQPFGSETVLRLWDFGGQDIYHGTHALFMQNRAVFILVWTPDSENSVIHEHARMTFRNRPLAWWLAWVHYLAGPESPVLLVQNQCETAKMEWLRPPVSDKMLGKFPFRRELHYSALNRRGESTLKEALELVVEWLRERQGPVRISKGRLAVKARLDALLAEDAAVTDSSKRQHRTLSMEQYEQICAECGGVSSPSLLLDYLHRTGVVFYKSGLFGNRIILDQGWALEAVYTVFNRKACYQPLKTLRGRFTRTLLESLIWQDYSLQEQELFLDLMQSCGICFVHRKKNKQLEIEAEYLAAALLPDYAEVETEVRAQWNEAAPSDERTLELPFLHPGVMRGLLSRIGNAAGMAAVYWRDGVCLYENATASHGRIQQLLEDSATEWRGSIVIHTQGGRSGDLLELLWEWVLEAVRQSGLQPAAPSIHTPPSTVLAPEEADRKKPAVSSVPEFAHAPRTGTTHAVSYAWRDEGVERMEELCRHAKARGIHILRDVDNLGLGEKISKFMAAIARQDRIFVILSDRYLRSENCMFELMEIWRCCQQDEEKFHRQVRVYTMPDADITSLAYQLEIIGHWTRQLEAVAPQMAGLVGKTYLSEAILRRFNNLGAFAHHVGVIIPYIADRLCPRDFAEFLEHGFSD